MLLESYFLGSSGVTFAQFFGPEKSFFLMNIISPPSLAFNEGVKRQVGACYEGYGDKRRCGCHKIPQRQSPPGDQGKQEKIPSGRHHYGIKAKESAPIDNQSFCLPWLVYVERPANLFYGG